MKIKFRNKESTLKYIIIIKFYSVQKFLFTFTICSVLALLSKAQTPEQVKWWNPANNSFPVLEGQAWPNEVKNYYDRLPARAEKNVRKEVWDLSKNSAGLYIKFRTDAGKIEVRYGVSSKSNFAMPHMPATGVSGVDLYAIDYGGRWVWAPGKYHFGDTITYTFSNLEPGKEKNDMPFEYRLFLPLYNTVSWLEIGIPEGKTFIPLPLSTKKPIVVYGTSIAQGGCASRPGVAWTAILERELNRPLINLSFSGNGKLEKPMIDFISEIDAEIYVLDCLPNLTNLADPELETKIRNAVSGLQSKHPAVPILLAEHSLGAVEGVINRKWVNDCTHASEILRQTFTTMLREGIKNIYLLTNTEIGFDVNSTVDGIHPADIGMKQYADAYIKSIRKIMYLYNLR